MSNELSIYKKLLQVKKRVPYIKKDEKNFQYTYASPSQVFGIINPILNELGLILITNVVNSKSQRIEIETKNLGIKFDLYVDWLFDDLKIMENDDVGFIFYEEMEDYINLLRKGEGLYLNDILKRSLKCHSERIRDNQSSRNIFFDGHCHRVVETIPVSFGEKYIGGTNKNDINTKYERLFLYDCLESEL